MVSTNRKLKPVISLICISAVMLMTACGGVRQVTSTSETKVEVRERVEFKPIIVEVEIPPARLERETRDTSSHLETEYSVSDAVITKDGRLLHSLENKPKKIKKEMSEKTTHKDSLVYDAKAEIKEVPVPVEKKLSLWQKIRLSTFYILLALVVWAYRKSIWGIMKKLLSLFKLL